MKKAPKIRIKGFEGEWKTCTLSDIATFSKGHGYSKNDLTNKKDATPIILYGRMYTKYEPIIIKVDTFAYLLPNSILSEGNEVIVPASGETAEDISVASAICTKGIIIGGDLNILKPKEGIFAPFLALNITYSHAHYELSKKAQGKTIVHLHNDDFKDVHVCYPTLSEQHAIATYFHRIDSLIETADKKIASLKQVKEASLQSMFPKEGQKVPEVRFKGFEGEWKIDELGNLFTERVESDVFAEMLSVTQSQGIIKANENGRYDNSNNDKSKYRLVKVGDIAYNSMRMWQGASGYSPYYGIVSPAYTVVVPNNNVDSCFFAYMFKTAIMIKQFRLHSQGLTTDTWNLKFPAFSKIVVTYPADKAEQRKIASFFVHLDKQIAIAQQRLDLLRRIKSACLDEMFV